MVNEETKEADYGGMFTMMVSLIKIGTHPIKNSSDPIGFPLKIAELLSWYTCPYLSNLKAKY